MAVKDKDYRNPMLQIRISPELEERLNKVSSMFGVTKGEVARMAIGQYVGQITGTMEQVAKAQTVDYEKIVEAMIPKLIEVQKQEEEERKCKE